MNLPNHVTAAQRKVAQDAHENRTATVVSNIITAFLWLLLAGNLCLMAYYLPHIPEWHYPDVLRFNGFTLLIWTTVSFFGAVVSTYASNYLKGFRFHTRFMVLCLLFTLSVMLFVVSAHVGLLVLAWLVMGVIMATLIGIDTQWGEAREAFKFTLRYFVLGTILLGTGIFLLAHQTGAYTLSGLLAGLEGVPTHFKVVAVVCIITAAIVQSAIYPFHRWLLSAMTAPTPASALMHAGFVNGAGILLTLFSTLLFATDSLTILFVIGGLTAIIAQFTKLLQVNVKQKLACSTIAQMGFMIMQCGLGFFNAAVAHLILHGFYKAYLFLASGEEVSHALPKKPLSISIKPLEAFVVLVFGSFGAYLFILLTGKGMHIDSGIFLTLIVAITVGQATYNIVKERSLTYAQKTILPSALFIVGIFVYALMYNGVTLLMGDMPMVAVVLPLSTVQMVFGAIFLIGFFIMKLGIYQNIPWLYVKLMNISQPSNKSILRYKPKSK